MFLTEDPLLLRVTRHHCDVVTSILEKTERSSRLKVSQIVDANDISERDLTGLEIVLMSLKNDRRQAFSPSSAV